MFETNMQHIKLYKKVLYCVCVLKLRAHNNLLGYRLWTENWTIAGKKKIFTGLFIQTRPTLVTVHADYGSKRISSKRRVQSQKVLFFRLRLRYTDNLPISYFKIKIYDFISRKF